MKTIKIKKLPLGLIAVLCLLAVAGLALVLPKKAQAVTSPNGPAFSVNWFDRSTIVVNSKDGTISGLLIDSQWDDNWNYSGLVASDKNLADCSSDTTVDGFGGNVVVGLSDANGKPGWDANAAKANIDLPQNGCTAGIQGGIDVGSINNARIFYSWTDSSHSTIERVDGDSSWVMTGGQKTSSGKLRFYRNSEAGDKCQDYIDATSDFSSMILYELTSDSINSSGVKSPVPGCYFVWTLSDLLVSSSSHSETPSNMSLPLGDLSKRPTPKLAAGNTTACKQDDKNCLNTTKSCESNFSFGFEWGLCPALRMADNTAGAFNDFVENQLDVCTGKSSTTGQTCNDNNLSDQVHKGWIIFSRLASVTLVIVLLIMVISQAAGWGGLDAYTVRKMLPRLIIAALFIQISWVMLKWFIDLSNDLGHGIQDLLFAPFGGSNNIQLDKLMGAQIQTATAGHVGATGFAFFTVVAALGVAWVSLPAIFSLAIIVIFALLTAFLTLVFRKVLIITLVILSPIAFIAWLLPGADKYWKMWFDNFQRVLLMFPMIMALIAGGRILAYVTSNSSGSTTSVMPHLAVAHLGALPVPYFASVTNFAQLAIIVVAYFGPYFLLPQTYKWGGEFMRMAGDRIKGASDKLSEKPKEYAKDRGESWREERRRKAKERVARQGDRFTANPITWVRTPMDKFRSGKWDPLLGVGRIPKLNPDGSRRRQRAVDSYIKKGEESHQEDLAAAEARIVRERQEHRAAGGDHDLYLQAIADGKTEYFDPSLGEGKGKQVQIGRRGDEDRMAARRQLAKLGAGMNWRYLENYYEQTMESGSAEDKANMRRFFDDNVDTILPKLPHIYKSIHQAADADPSAIANMHGVEVEAILSNLSQDVADPTRGGRIELTQDEIAAKRARAQSSLTTFMNSFQNAVESSQRGGAHLENGALRAMKAYLEPEDAQGQQELLDGINGRVDPAGNPRGDVVHGRQAPLRNVGNPADPDYKPPMPGERQRSLIRLRRSQEIPFDPNYAPVVEQLRQSLGPMINKGGFVNPAQQPPQPPGGNFGGDGVDIPHPPNNPNPGGPQAGGGGL